MAIPAKRGFGGLRKTGFNVPVLRKSYLVDVNQSAFELLSLNGIACFRSHGCPAENASKSRDIERHAGDGDHNQSIG
jgi:hypothetical protein